MAASNRIDGDRQAGILKSVNDVRIRDNPIHNAREDLLWITGNGYACLVENTGRDL